MSGPPTYPPVLVPRRSATGLVCVLIGVASFVLAIAVSSDASEDSSAAASARTARSQSAGAASSSRSVAASLPSPQELRSRFPRPPGAFQKPEDEPNRGTYFYYTRGLTRAQVQAFYVAAIPRTFPALECRFESVVPGGVECPLRRDVDFAQVDVWSKSDNLRPGEIFIRLTIGPS